ncbi:hypothetical protein [Acinetobacter indicus]|uniref:hypothetical protein n=1 Tax=Acinetobacter indicus TaxID=756892 RepID=UPI0032B40B42
MTMFLAPYTAIADIDGSPLDAGFLFFGEYGKDPELFPVEVFWDSDFTVPAVQPIRTRNGYPVRNGSPTKVYLKTAQHSIVIKNRNSAFILVDFNNKGWSADFVIDGNENQHQINNSLIRTVKTPDELLLIQNPKNKQIIHVESIQKTFIYDVNLTTPDNGVTVIGKWEMEVQDAYYASWFAEPSVTTDQSAGLRVGYAYATSKKRAFIVDDHFYVDSSISSGDPNGNPTALKTLSNSVLAFTPNGKIEHLPTNKSSYNVIHTMDVENYVILDPVLIGERDNHIDTTGEWGYLLTIYQSTNGYIRRPQCFNAWGDGIYIGKAAGTVSNDVPTNIIVEDAIVDRARRNGISFTAGNKVKIIRPIVSNTSGVSPEAGLDIEPEEVGLGVAFPATITNSIIDNPTFLNNTRNIWVSWYGNGRHIDVRFTGVTKLVGDSFPLTIYARSWAVDDTQSGVVYFECIDYTCTNANNRFETELMFEDRGAIVDVDKMIIRKATKWVTHFVRFGTLDKPLKGLSVKSIDSQTLVDAYFTTTSVSGDKVTLRPVLNLGFGDNVYVMTDPGNASNIVYGVGNIGGYSVRTSVSSENSSNYPANRIVVTPYVDAYLRLNNDFRRLKIVIDSVDESIHRTLYIHGLNVALLDGTVKTSVTLQGKGAWIDIQKNSSGRDTLFNLFGNAS